MLCILCRTALFTLSKQWIAMGNISVLSGQIIFSFLLGSRVPGTVTTLDLNLRTVLSTSTFFSFPTKMELKSETHWNRIQHNLMTEFFIMVWSVLSVIMLGQFQCSPQLTWTWSSHHILPTWWFLSRNRAEIFLVRWIIITIPVTLVFKKQTSMVPL